jgi:hypothetical protein
MTPPRTISQETSQAQIDVLGERMDKGFNEIKEMLLRYEERLRGLETREAGCAPLISSRVEAAWRKIDGHETELNNLRATLTEMGKVSGQLESIAKWMLGIFTALIISLMIAFLTGKIDILFR